MLSSLIRTISRLLKYNKQAIIDEIRSSDSQIRADLFEIKDQLFIISKKLDDRA